MHLLAEPVIRTLTPSEMAEVVRDIVKMLEHVGRDQREIILKWSADVLKQ